jgi:hypothetical protein
MRLPKTMGWFFYLKTTALFCFPQVFDLIPNLALDPNSTQIKKRL